MQVKVFKNKTGYITSTGCRDYCDEIRIQTGDTVTETTCCKKKRCNNAVRPLFSVSQRHSVSFTLVIVSSIATLRTMIV